MLELLTAGEMGAADRAAIAGGIPGIELMENAGAAVAEAAAALAPEGPILVVAGGGNNGGDGAVAARLLQASGRDVTLMLAGDPARLRGDAASAFARWRGTTIAARPDLPPAALVVDALFGAGLDRPVEGEAAALVAAMNDHPAPILAVDVPSGLDSSTGQPRGVAVRAAASVTFFRKKPGHLLFPGRGLCGPVTLAQIGIPDAVLAPLRIATWENGPDLWARRLAPPSETGHKYQRGHALVVSGPMWRTGAARLAAGAALRAGAGLVTLASPPGALAVNAAHLTAVMLRRVDGATDLEAVLEDPRFTATALGPGLGTGPEECEIVRAALAAQQGAVLDADAVTAFEDRADTLFEWIAARPAPTVLTPHEGEFRRLFPDLVPSPERSRLEAARAAAARAAATVVLKGPDTVIAAPDGRAAINANAPPWLATAGSGDVLTGIVAGLLARGIPGFPAACAAVWLHGAAGSAVGPGLIAEDLAPALRGVFAALWSRDGAAPVSA
jgi:ADP-dependent NAD(P)H-hydrate dehydratase / NAD(P)H-hydrate epimerase